jgi:predicted  nucleic acid-binding Zn-ribbon protein
MKNNDYVTKNYLKKTLDKAFEKNNKVLLEAISSGFDIARREREEIKRDIDILKIDITKLREGISNIYSILDNFTKKFVNLDDEFTIMKAEISKIKKVFKEKFKINISLMD